MSSRAGHAAAKNCSDELKAKFSSTNNLTVPEAEQLMMDFVK